MEFYTPKNFKNGKFLMNRFRKLDLLLLFIGLGMTVVLFYSSIISLVIYKYSVFFGLLFLLFSLLPLGIVILLVFIPTQVKHNLLEVIKIHFLYKKRKKSYYWGGVQHFEQKENRREKN